MSALSRWMVGLGLFGEARRFLSRMLTMNHHFPDYDGSIISEQCCMIGRGSSVGEPTYKSPLASTTIGAGSIDIMFLYCTRDGILQQRILERKTEIRQTMRHRPNDCGEVKVLQLPSATASRQRQRQKVEEMWQRGSRTVFAEHRGSRMANYHTAHPVRTVGTAFERSSLGTRHGNGARVEGIFAGCCTSGKGGVN